MQVEFKPEGVCCSSILVDYSGEYLVDVRFTGGCQGNLEAVRKLIVGKKLTEIIEVLSGIDCRGKGTSCTDQLCKFLKEVVDVPRTKEDDTKI